MNLKRIICMLILLFAGIISSYSASSNEAITSTQDHISISTAPSLNTALIDNSSLVKEEINSIINEDINLTTPETNKALREAGQTLGQLFPLPSLKKYINDLVNEDDIEMSRDTVHDIIVHDSLRNSCILKWWNVIASVSDPLAWLLTGSLTVLSAFAAIYEDKALMLNSIMVIIGSICTVMKGVTKYSSAQANKIQDKQIIEALYRHIKDIKPQIREINPQNNAEELV